uniref:uncharacterized protein LOC122605867 n=1 Tax=Erigeron canadensis TaxID=72917 RepID=UPI001CB8CAC9|nr:uncharacterized protein LOC122605867 [Erigeron canadensis]
MPVAKLLDTSTPDAMIAEETTSSLDTFIRQAVGKEPFFSFSRTGDNPLQWIQFLHTMDQPDLPGWPLLTPVKVQMQKCDKCAHEFCSPINYRRHIRVHRRSMNFPKEPQKFRDILGTFWDKLEYDKAKEIMSLKDVNLEEVPGVSVVRNIVSNIRNPMFFSLPQAYVKAGSALVDIIQGRPSSLPISSQDLFSLLDDASEGTFLCAGTAKSLHKYVFDGEVGKVGLEIRNLIACTTLLVEQELVKAWFADKDVEALRCQKLLVEEEEAAKRRQSQLLERKRRRKLRQKEQRARDGLKAEVYPASDIFKSIPSADSSSPQVSPEADHLIPDEYAVATLDPTQLSHNEEVSHIDHSDICTEQERMHGNGSQDLIPQWEVPKKSPRASRNAFRSNQNGNVIKWEHAHKHREQKINGGKVWTRKPRSENGEVIQSRVHNSTINQTIQSNCQLMIGSISVTLRNSTGQHQVNSQLDFKENGTTEIKTKGAQNDAEHSNVKFCKPRHDTGGQLADKSNRQILEEDATSERGTDQTLFNENHQKSCNLNGLDSKGTNDSNVQAEDGAKAKRISIDSQQNGAHHSSVKFWKPRHDTGGQLVDRSNSQILEGDAASERGTDQTLSNESHKNSCNLNGLDSKDTNDSYVQAEDGAKAQRVPFSVDAAKAFLSQRWKEAISGDHVELVLTSALEPPGQLDGQDDHQVSAAQEYILHGGPKGQVGKTVGINSSTHATVEPKFRKKTDKSIKTKYIPKQRAFTSG